MRNPGIKKLFFVLFSLVFLGCQRDDICPESTQTTPLLIIRFYDADEPEETQPPVNLTVKEAGNDTILLYRVNQDSIAIPLRTNIDATEYEFIYDANEIPEDGDDEDDEDSMQHNVDVINFNYTREEVYVNRACAYKVNYLNLKTTLDPEEDGMWINRMRIDQIDVEDETSAHISIFY